MAVAAALAFAAWQWFVPPEFESVRGLNPAAVIAWRGAFGLASHGRSTAPQLALYAALFRGCLVLAFAAYAGLWLTVWRSRPGDDPFSARWTWPVAVPLIGLLAVFQPANLSTDVFAYVGYARLAVVHGLNPYLHTQTELVALGDPTAAYLHWPIASPYGPLWTLLSMVVVIVAPHEAVWGPVVALKLLAGGALLATAGMARALVGQRDPQRANGVFLLVALNPLLLIEGPGNGHNDLFMVALLLGGLWALSRARSRTAAVLVGLSVVVKLVPAIVGPWLAVLAARAAAPPWYRRASTGLVVIALALAPVVITYAPFWEGVRTMDGLTQRFRHGASPAHSGVAAVLRSWPALLVCLWGSFVVAFGRGEPAFRLATVWCLLALAAMLFVAGLWFPWYLAWLWPVLVLRFTRLHMALTAFALPFSLLLMLAYAMPPG